MSFVYVHTDNTSEALYLQWEDYTQDITYTSTTTDTDGTLVSTTVTEPYTHLGLQSAYPLATSVNQLPGFTEAKVEDNIIYQADTSTYSYDDIEITTTGGTRIQTTREVEGFSLTLSCPALYMTNANGYAPATVEIGIYYRVYGTTGAWHVVTPSYKIVGIQRSEILRTLSVPNCADGLAVYEILVARVTADHTADVAYVDRVYVKDLTEINYSSVAYNHTAIMGVKIRATDQLSGSPPTITSLVKGAKVHVPSNLVDAYTNRYEPVGSATNPKGNYAFWNSDAAYEANDWDGQMSEETVWVDNPVWCLYDLLTNKRYGLGDYYKIADHKLGLMRANFYMASQYCDEGLPYTDLDQTTGLIVSRPRFALNMVIDQSKSAIEWIAQICGLMRANMYYSEGIFWLDIDRPKQMSQLFNMTNITEYSQSCTSFRDIPNSYEVQWVNPEKDYIIDSFKLEDLDLQLDNTIEERKKALTLTGCTNYDQARSLAKYALLTGKYCTKIVTFKTGTDGLRSMVGDVIGIQHDVPRWGWGGLITEVDLEATNGIAVTLSAPINPEPDMELSIAFKPPLGEMQTVELLNGSWNSSEFSTVVLADTPDVSPEVGDQYIIGHTEATVAAYRITGIKRTEDDFCEISAVEYFEQLYSMCDDATDSGVFKKPVYPVTPPTQRVSVSGVTASVKNYQDVDGDYKVGIEVNYNIPTSSFWKEAQVWWRRVGATVFSTMAANADGYFFIDNITQTGEYLIVVTSIYTLGKQSTADALGDKVNHPYTSVTVDTTAPSEEFSDGITGLRINNVANDGTFTGADCELIWNKPVVTSTQTNTIAGLVASTSSADTWVGSYIVTIIGVDGKIRRTATGVAVEAYTYTHAMNFTDAVDGDADRKFTVSVVAVDKWGRKSKAKSLECYNPAPVAIAAT